MTDDAKRLLAQAGDPAVQEYYRIVAGKDAASLAAVDFIRATLEGELERVYFDATCILSAVAVLTRDIQELRDKMLVMGTKHGR